MQSATKVTNQTSHKNALTSLVVANLLKKNCSKYNRFVDKQKEDQNVDWKFWAKKRVGREIDFPRKSTKSVLRSCRYVFMFRVAFDHFNQAHTVIRGKSISYSFY